MPQPFGYNGAILHVDLSKKSLWVEKPSENWYRQFVGGGLMGTALLLDGTSPALDAYSAENCLIFISSVIAGIEAPGLARFSVVTKSPLSQGIAESRCEGPFGTFLKGSGYDAIVIKGKSEQPCYLKIENGKLSFHSAEDLWGTSTWHTTKKLEEIHGQEELQVASIGQAGENLVRFASIVTDYSIQAMRMGTGAVMGSKNLKALVIKGKNSPVIFDPEGLARLSGEFHEAMLKNTLSLWQKNPPGFAASTDLSDYDTAYIGFENYSSNLRVENSHYNRDAYMPFYRGEKACPGCPNDCIKIIGSNAEFPESAGIHQEVTGSLGPNIGNGDIELMLEANKLCNLYGIDPVSLGFTLSFAMECSAKGIIAEHLKADRTYKFGDKEELLVLVRDIVFRKGLGDLLAEGCLSAAKQIGHESERFALHVKGIEMVSFEPRTMTNLAIGYATSPIGPRYDICEHDWDFDTISGWDHTLDYSRTLGILDRIPMEELSLQKVRYYKALNNLWSACDALNLCIFASAPTRVWSLEKIAELIHCITGWRTSSYEFIRWGERRNHIMRLYNIREGLTACDDRLPDRFFDEPVRNGRLRGVVLNKTKFQAAIHCYYEMMGWDSNGVPLNATLIDHNLLTYKY